MVQAVYKHVLSTGISQVAVLRRPDYLQFDREIRGTSRQLEHELWDRMRRGNRSVM